VLKALHGDECIPTECILHLPKRPIPYCRGAIALSSSITARFTSLPQKSKVVANSTSAQIIPAAKPEFSDGALLVKVCEGDRDCLALLFRRYAHLVRNVGKRILRDKTEAEDLVQEVFLYIHRKSSVFDSSKGSASSWIVQVAYTQALLRRRRLKSQGFYLSGITDKRDECDQANHIGADYDRTVEGLFGRNGWKKIVEDLTPDQRETFRLHFFEGYTFTEIAEKLDQSYANVRNHHYRGLEKLRRHLAEDEFKTR
jgi:RNA polymerase sigma-70 factor (ECF subfamily)